MPSRATVPPDVTISCTPPIAFAVDVIRQERHRKARDVVIIIKGNDDIPRAHHEPIFTEDEMYLIFETVQECIPHLQKLRLEWNLMHAQHFEQPPLLPLGVLRLILESPELHTLALYRMQLTGDPLDYQDLEEAVAQNTTLHAVRVEFCKTIGSPNLDNTVTTFSKLPNLKEIEVIGIAEFAARVCTSQSVQVLGDCQKLQCLKLWGGIWQDESENAVTALTQGLKATKSLNYLEIGLFKLNLPSSIAIADLIKHNNSLGRVWLDSNIVINEETLAPLTEALKVNSSITHFSIVCTTAHHQSIKTNPKITQLLVDMLEKNYSLRQCNIRTGREAMEEDDDSPLQAQLDFYLLLNRVLARQVLLGSKITDRVRWVVALSLMRENTSVIYYLLSRNPAFISQCVTNPRKRILLNAEGFGLMSRVHPIKKRRKLGLPKTPQLTNR